MAIHTFVVEMDNTQTRFSTSPFGDLQIGVVELGLGDQVKIPVRLGWHCLRNHSGVEPLGEATRLEQSWCDGG